MVLKEDYGRWETFNKLCDALKVNSRNMTGGMIRFDNLTPSMAEKLHREYPESVIFQNYASNDYADTDELIDFAKTHHGFVLEGFLTEPRSSNGYIPEMVIDGMHGPFSIKASDDLKDLFNVPDDFDETTYGYRWIDGSYNFDNPQKDLCVWYD